MLHCACAPQTQQELIINSWSNPELTKNVYSIYLPASWSSIESSSGQSVPSTGGSVLVVSS